MLMNGIRFFIVSLLVGALFASPVAASPYSDMIKATDAYAAAIAEQEKANAEWDALRQLGSPWETNRRRAKEVDARQRDAAARVAKTRKIRDQKMKAWRASIKAYTDLIELAQKTRDQILKDPQGLAINRQRAAGAIEADLAKLQPGVLPELARAQQELAQLLRAGRPFKEIEEQIATRADLDDTGKYLLGEILGQIDEHFHDLPQTERMKEYDQLMGSITKAVKLAGLFTPSTEDPLKNQQIRKLTSLTDLAADIVPAQAMSLQVKVQKALLEHIQNQIDALQIIAIKRNLLALREGAKDQSIPYGDRWFNLHEELIFGIPLPNPAVLPDKTEFKKGAPITGRWYGSLRYDKSAWLGIVPSKIVRGSEVTSDQHDIKYITLGNDHGVFRFKVDLEPGLYDLRMYDNDDGGNEVAVVTISVTDPRNKPAIDLTGDWVGNDYHCEDTDHVETVRVQHAGNDIVATKLTGDNCVVAGQTTFHGETDGALACIVGSPGDPGSGFVTGWMSAIEADSFTACQVHFKRKS